VLRMQLIGLTVRSNERAARPKDPTANAQSYEAQRQHMFGILMIIPYQKPLAGALTR
jgi:hypothetical protein